MTFEIKVTYGKQLVKSNSQLLLVVGFFMAHSQSIMVNTSFAASQPLSPLSHEQPTTHHSEPIDSGHSHQFPCSMSYVYTIQAFAARAEVLICSPQVFPLVPWWLILGGGPWEPQLGAEPSFDRWKATSRVGSLSLVVISQ